jgi:hypothetical protein
MKKTDKIFGLALPVLLLSACGQDQAPSEDAAVVDEAAAVVEEPASEMKVMAYGRFVPEREDDFTWENDKVAFRVYGPSSGGKGSVSGVDPWFKKVDYSIIDKWYANFLQDISYHEDHGEGYDIYHVGPSRGVGGTAIWVDGVAYAAAMFKSRQRCSRATKCTRVAAMLSNLPCSTNGKRPWVRLPRARRFLWQWAASCTR